jgi:hypothetical protein
MRWFLKFPSTVDGLLNILLRGTVVRGTDRSGPQDPSSECEPSPSFGRRAKHGSLGNGLLVPRTWAPCRTLLTERGFGEGLGTLRRFATSE